MGEFGSYTDIAVNLDDQVAVVEIQRAPNNFFDELLIRSIADAFEDLQEEAGCRAIVLASAGKHFCAGANLGFTGQPSPRSVTSDPNSLYRQGVRLFRTAKPIVGAIQGAAVGGGLGLSLVPDFRVACEEARFSANFSRLGFYPGFGLTTTLPELIGSQQASMMLMTGRRVKGSPSSLARAPFGTGRHWRCWPVLATGVAGYRLAWTGWPKSGGQWPAVTWAAR